jgi:heptosyltransferase-2
MSWKRALMDGLVVSARAFARNGLQCPAEPESIFVLRNNDLGDLLVVTPLFEALRRRFPGAKIIAGIGDWNRDALAGNPFVDEILSLNAPWHNKFSPNLSPPRALAYIYFSREARALRRRNCAAGIDVLGSPYGSLLLMRAMIPWRLGVKGYAGGHRGTQAFVEFDPREHVGRASLKFAQQLGAKDLPSPKPQIYLNAEEEEAGRRVWKEALPNGIAGRPRVVIGPGGGFAEKLWPAGNFADLALRMTRELSASGLVVGGPQDVDAADAIERATGGAFVNLAGKLRLRETFAVLRGANFAVCNSSMLMHACAAFDVHAFVLLGPYFASAVEHAAQWGHEDATAVLGRGPERPSIFGVEETLAEIRRFCENRFPA